MLLRTLVLGFGLLVIQLVMIIWVQKWYIVDIFATNSNTKFVRFHLNYGRLGNQLFHFITGYGIARTLGRRHYIPILNESDHVSKYLKQMTKVFPRLQETFVIAPVSYLVKTQLPCQQLPCGHLFFFFLAFVPRSRRFCCTASSPPLVPIIRVPRSQLHFGYIRLHTIKPTSLGSPARPSAIDV
ncbi:hypothetical protein Y032_0244g3531 [Ancylostoma ceylanicum]|uniref:Uncharacterized protein n=1 Tax=Ancylostoma ceylanicum TaxID=53326 RepID=A0A016SE43_9BILA|nr:hypothetical protein Y032_0244g3531 [Ancylostoma ceylanicum]